MEFDALPAGSVVLEHSSCFQWQATVVLKPMVIRRSGPKMEGGDLVVYHIGSLEI
jgi:hypothetical protein